MFQAADDAMSRSYRGIRTNGGNLVEATAVFRGGGTPTCHNYRLPLRRDIHALATSFDWGKEGNGAAQLSLAILADLTKNDSYACDRFEAFSEEVVVGLDGPGWVLEEPVIREWLSQRRLTRNEMEAAEMWWQVRGGGQDADPQPLWERPELHEELRRHFGASLRLELQCFQRAVARPWDPDARDEAELAVLDRTRLNLAVMLLDPETSLRGIDWSRLEATPAVQMMEMVLTNLWNKCGSGKRPAGNEEPEPDADQSGV